MKSKINKIKESTKPYPKLMYCIDDINLIVLFCEYQQEMVVSSDSKGDFRVGHLSAGWSQEANWRDFEGEVVLSNE